MSWNPATGRFPASNQLSMSQIKSGFNLQGGTQIGTTFKLSDFVGRTLYNTDGASYTVPSLPLSISYFYNRIFLNPAPLTLTYTSGTYSSPNRSDKPIPTSFQVTVIGGGGGGGGAGGGYRCDAGIFGVDQQSGGGGGGGGAGEKVDDSRTYTYNTTFVVVIGVGGSAGGGNGNTAGCADGSGPGSDGGDGASSSITYNGTITARGGKKGSKGTGAFYDGGAATSRQGSGGAGGVGGNPGTGNGGSGVNGTSGSGGVSPNGVNGYGGVGGGGNNGGGGNSGEAGGDGIVTITWYYT
jgi:hypothetical protein